jgi:para-nitrobenzyl esterase
VWQVIVDGQVLREAVQATFAKSQQAKVPLMTGFNAQEASPYAIPEIQTAESFVAYAQNSFGDKAADFLKLYPARSDAEALDLSYKVARDRHFGWGPWKWAKLHTETSSAPAYMWFFNQQPPIPSSLKLKEAVPPGGHGAFHGSELWYWFGTQDGKNWAWTDTDRKISDAMTSYIVNFARKGDPNGDSLPRWPRFEAKDSRAMVFTQTIGEAPLANRPMMEFFDAYYQSKPAGAPAH